MPHSLTALAAQERSLCDIQRFFDTEFLNTCALVRDGTRRGRKDDAAFDPLLESVRNNQENRDAAEKWIHAAFTGPQSNGPPASFNVDDKKTLRIMFNFIASVQLGDHNKAIMDVHRAYDAYLSSQARDDSRSRKGVKDTQLNRKGAKTESATYKSQGKQQPIQRLGSSSKKGRKADMAKREEATSGASLPSGYDQAREEPKMASKDSSEPSSTLKRKARATSPSRPVKREKNAPKADSNPPVHADQSPVISRIPEKRLDKASDSPQPSTKQVVVQEGSTRKTRKDKRQRDPKPLEFLPSVVEDVSMCPQPSSHIISNSPTEATGTSSVRASNVPLCTNINGTGSALTSTKGVKRLSKKKGRRARSVTPRDILERPQKRSRAEGSAASKSNLSANHGVLSVMPGGDMLQVVHVSSTPVDKSISPSILGSGPAPQSSSTRDVGNRSMKRTREVFEEAAHQTEQYDPIPGLLSPRRLVRNKPSKVLTHVLIPRHTTAASKSADSNFSCPQLDHHTQDAAKSAYIVHTNAVPSLEDWSKEVNEEQCNDPSFQDLPILEDQSATTLATAGKPRYFTCAKPLLPVRPPIWSFSRQEMCESFVHFRSYQGGVYYCKDVVKGYLLSAFSANRDLFHHGGKLIISHGGGKSESLLSRVSGSQVQLAEDQESTDRSVRALLKNYTENRSLVLLVDDKYALFPYDLRAGGCTYAVLGFYRIVHAWAEYQPANNTHGRVVRYKFAFQWCESQGAPWWLSRDKTSDENPPMDLETARQSEKVLRRACDNCKKESPRVYNQGWMCLKPDCDDFWLLPGRKTTPPEFNYDDRFLQLVPIILDDCPTLLPRRVLLRPPDGITTTEEYTKGWHCRECGRLSSRFKWEQWECSHCGAFEKVIGRIREPSEFWQFRSNTMHDSLIGKNSGIAPCQTTLFDHGSGYTYRLTFVLPHQWGKIHLIKGTLAGNKAADRIFRDYQEQAANGELLLQRYPLRNHKLRGSLLANYFSQNSGEPYQYVGGTGNTVPFSAAPTSVLGALELIKERAQQSLEEEVSFNEILNVAYMERQKMSFHSDSERGLGPVVASLSLGAPAYMHFRVRHQKQPHEGHRKHALSLFLRHGDVLVMQGSGVQECYEHTVVPVNFRIAATARFIGPSNSGAALTKVKSD